MYYVNTFFLFSILGHFIENFFYVTKDSGIFFGWWTPIYGIGVCIVIYLYKLVNKIFNILALCVTLECSLRKALRNLQFNAILLLVPKQKDSSIDLNGSSVPVQCSFIHCCRVQCMKLLFKYGVGGKPKL